MNIIKRKRGIREILKRVFSVELPLLCSAPKKEKNVWACADKNKKSKKKNPQT